MLVISLFILPFILFLPGFLLMKLLFLDLEVLELLLLSIASSLLLLVCIGLFLNLFEAINSIKLWEVEILVITFLLLMLFFLKKEL